MILYVKLGRVRGLSVEINMKLGLKPFYRRNSFRHETILDIPCTQIIYTSGRWRKRSRVLLKSSIRSIPNVDEETKQTANSSKRINQHR